MDMIVANIPSLSFLGTDVYLLMHEHFVAGGFCLLVACFAATVVNTKDKEEKDGNS